MSRSCKDRGRFTFHCLPSHNKMFTMFPFVIHFISNALLFLPNSVTWNWLVKTAEDEIGPGKCDFIRSHFSNALLSYTSKRLILLYLNHLNAKCWNLFFFRAFNFVFFLNKQHSCLCYITNHLSPNNFLNYLLIL